MSFINSGENPIAVKTAQRKLSFSKNIWSGERIREVFMRRGTFGG